MLASTGRYAP